MNMLGTRRVRERQRSANNPSLELFSASYWAAVAQARKASVAAFSVTRAQLSCRAQALALAPTT